MYDLDFEDYNNLIIQCFEHSRNMNNCPRYPLEAFINLFTSKSKISSFCYIIAHMKDKAASKLKLMKKFFNEFSQVI